MRKKPHTIKISRVKSVSDMEHTLDEINSRWDTGRENVNKLKDTASSNYPKWSTERKPKLVRINKA